MNRNGKRIRVFADPDFASQFSVSFLTIARSKPELVTLSASPGLR